MAEITVRVLDESEWRLYSDLRLRALEESPESFSAQLADEVDHDEQFWRGRMDRYHQLLAERDGRPQGIASLGPYAAEPSAGEIFGLYVVPEARSTGVSWRLVEAARSPGERRGPSAAVLLGGHRQWARDRFREELRVPLYRCPPPIPRV
jgi:GNAT superfamily N-acetyltransferase